MSRIISAVHQGLARITLAVVLLQFYLAGLALFGAVSSFELHRTLGYLIVVPVLLGLILALAGRLGRRQIGLSALLVILIIVQAMLPSLRATVPLVAALHPVNALALLGVSATLGRPRRTQAPEMQQPAIS